MRGMLAPVFSVVTFWIGILTCGAVCIERVISRRKADLDSLLYAVNLNPRGVLARPEYENQGESKHIPQRGSHCGPVSHRLTNAFFQKV